MAPLYGRLRGNRGEATRTGFEEITATLQTWEGRVTVTLTKDGTFTVEAGSLDGHARTVAMGNVNDLDSDVPEWVNG